jgi:hypothetical protein
MLDVAVAVVVGEAEGEAGLATATDEEPACVPAAAVALLEPGSRAEVVVEEEDDEPSPFTTALGCDELRLCCS